MQNTDPVSLTYGQLTDLVERIEEIPTLSGAGAPTASTPAFYKGQIYLDTTTNELYHCTSLSSSGQAQNYTWVQTGKTYNPFTGATSSAAGTAGLVPAPASGATDKYLKSNGTWATIPTSPTYTAGDGIDITNDIISATNTGKIRVLTTADYNYPVGNPTYVALWLLEPGIYTWPVSGVAVQPWSSQSWAGCPFIAIVTGGFSNGYTNIFAASNDWTSDYNQKIWMVRVRKSNGAYQAGTGFYPPIDNLSSAQSAIPLSAKQGKVLKDLVDSLVIRGSGAPTTSTVGSVGTLYEDTTNGKLYQCTAVDITTDPSNPSYTWEEVGGGPNVVQTLGTSTTDVMSQNATTNMVYPGNNTQKVYLGYDSYGHRNTVSNGVYIGSMISVINDLSDSSNTLIGDNAGAIRTRYSVALGYTAKVGAESTSVFNPYCVALGAGSRSTTPGSVAVGAFAKATTKGEMNIGVYDSAYRAQCGYNGSAYRLLSGVYDPQSDHDAATKGYVDTAVAGAGAPVYTNSEFNNLWENA